MRHLAGSSASCKRAAGLTLSRYDVLGSLRFGFRPDVGHPELIAQVPINAFTGEVESPPNKLGRCPVTRLVEG